MGYGDFKLLAALGAWLGWQSLPTIVLLSSVVGALVGISLVVFGRHNRSVPIPFGPYLAPAGWLTLVFGTPLSHAYLQKLSLTAMSLTSGLHGHTDSDKSRVQPL